MKDLTDSSAIVREVIADVTSPVDVTPVPRLPPSGEAVLVMIQPAGGLAGRRFELSAGEHLVGRTQSAEIAIDAISVSRRHARVLWDGDGWWVEDLGSRNGTAVNGRKVDRERLRDGDIVAFGGAALKFLEHGNLEVSFHEELYRRALQDSLTGLWNQRRFAEVLEREVARSARHRTPLSLVLFDIDHFKRINDAHGHPGGDAVLRGLGARLRGRARREDTLARIGGEEFAAVLAGTDRAGAMTYAEQLRRLVASEPFAPERGAIPVTISVGVATHDPAAPCAAGELYRRADERLYAAKHGGRDRVVG